MTVAASLILGLRHVPTASLHISPSEYMLGHLVVDSCYGQKYTVEE